MNFYLGIMLLLCGLGVLGSCIALGHPAPWPRVAKSTAGDVVFTLVARAGLAAWTAYLLFR